MSFITKFTLSTHVLCAVVWSKDGLLLVYTTAIAEKEATTKTGTELDKSCDFPVFSTRTMWEGEVIKETAGRRSAWSELGDTWWKS